MFKRYDGIDAQRTGPAHVEGGGNSERNDALSHSLSALSSRRQEAKKTRLQTRAEFGATDRFLVGPNLGDYRIICIGQLTSPIWAHFDWLGDVAISITSSIDPMAGLVRASKLPPNRLLLLCDIDGFDELEQAVEALVQFRRDYPDVTVVVASKGFGAHDFGVERAMLADASVKLPTGKVAMGLALGAAISNHRVIQSRKSA